MNKAVLMSIRPHWCELIASGKKTIEVRKTRPKIKTPFKVPIYETRERYKPWIDGTMTQEDARAFGICMKGGGKVIGEFVCDKITEYRCGGSQMLYFAIDDRRWAEVDQMCLTQGDLFEYGNAETLYGWHISDLQIYDVPRELKDFGLERAPQSWQFVEEIE